LSSAPVASGAGTGTTPTTDPSAVGSTPDVAPGTPGDGERLYQKEITGESAAECIDNFRQAAKQAMFDKCMEETDKNMADATGGNPNITPDQYQNSLKERIAEAEEEGDDEEASRLTSQLNRAQQAHCRGL